MGHDGGPEGEASWMAAGPYLSSRGRPGFQGREGADRAAEAWVSAKGMGVWLVVAGGRAGTWGM